MARPKSKITRTEYLELRLTEPEKRAFSQAAAIAGVALSTWVRERLRRAAVRELEEAAHVSGASLPTVFRRVLIPLLAPSLFAAWIYVVLVTVHELSTVLLLYSPGSEVIAVTFWNLWVNGGLVELAAFSLLVSATLLIAAMILLRLTRRFGGLRI